MSSIRLYFSNGSLCNTTISCDSLGIHYTVSKKSFTSPTVLTRWDSETNTNVFVGEFDRRPFKTHRIRIGEDGEWQVLTEFLHKGHGGALSKARSFEANNGIQYRWKMRNLTFVLTSAAEGDQEALIVYHQNAFSKEPSYLEVLNSSVISGLNNILLTFLIMEKKRRED
ncbi:hypothetical protein M408DRAFT_332137 [Serendipita vermifera MAFF 305830]|uniref:DUF6593 domain-containing protein n=1 Tax=Serendipita vermifera MAFF 305830 TaxID=933852 RepID=A0A0C3AGI5_SERVB|nr:hypothetical protein M408DRAFT_332137 [Serendipita vermifera MAFF 305830]